MFRKSLPLLLLAAAVGCPAAEPVLDTSKTDAGPNVSNDAGTETTPAFLASQKGHVRFKRNKRIAADFAQAMGIEPTAVCLEFGRYGCADFVHRITLGGVEPYVQGLNEPLAFTSVTTPFAAERMALYACRERVDVDLAGPGSARIFRDLGIGADGKLADVDADGVAASVARLYQHALLRNPTSREVDHLKQLYADIEADGAPGAGRDWAVLSCHVVLTSMESLFY